MACNKKRVVSFMGRSKKRVRITFRACPIKRSSKR
jgi:hypothetical protein